VLQGPRVVRVEAPDPVATPRPRVGPPAARPGGAPGASVPGAAPRRGRGKGRRDEAEEARARARNPRRHDTVLSEVDLRMREWRDQDLLERKERLASVTGHGLRDRRAAEKRRQVSPTTGPQPVGGRREVIMLVTPIALKDFCAAVGTPFSTVSKKLMEQTGRLWMINQTLEAELAELIAMELGVQVEIARARTAYEKLQDMHEVRERNNLRPRPPVVAMLGHVDHGKTSLLDAIRKTSVASGEAGGITQHIGAYRVKRGGWDVTFIDTPGHQAFTAMRARGATLTDVVVLVVAADDGVMPQTIEAINHAKAAGVNIVVALNKIDMPGVDVNRVLGQLAEHELTPSEWGGNIDVIRTSATKGVGIDDLVAHLSTLSELLDLKADPDVPAHGVVIEAEMREGQGVVAEILVREGTLKPGQFVVCGPAFGRVRSLGDDRGRMVREATPGTPVALSGLNELPLAGDKLFQVDSLRQAEEIAEEVRQQRRTESLQSAGKPRTLESLLAGAADGEIPELNVIIKCDVSGSTEVLKKTLGDVPASKARLKILHTAVGAISEADVHLAKASNAMILGFHVVPEDRARQLADQLGVEVRTYRIIYELMDDLTKALQGLLEPIKKEEIRATVEVRQVFNVSKIGTVAGCYVTDGTINRNHRIRLVRDGRVIVESAGLASLKRFKDDAREVRAGLECGVKLENYDDIKPGDVLQALEVVEIAQEL
jgi:translation initiation factor IF-2